MNSAHPIQKTRSVLFLVFCIWTFVLLGRPQDIFTFLVPFRPALLLGLATALLFVIRRSEHAATSSFNSFQVKLFAALVAVMIMGVPFAYYSHGAFKEIFTKYINVVLFFFLFFKIVNSIERLKTVLFVGCMGSGLYSVTTLLKGSFAEQRAFYGDAFDPNDLAFFALSFIPFNLLFLSGDNRMLKRLTCLGSLVAGVLLVLLSGSRGGFIAFSAVVLLLFLSKTHITAPGHKIAFAVLCVAIVFLNASKINFMRYRTITNLEQDYNTTAETGRVTVWKRGLRIIMTHPFTGVGVSCFPEAIARDREEKGLQPRWQTAHNIFVQVGTETGVFGVVIFALLNFRAYRIFGYVRRKAQSTELMKISEMARLGFTGHFIAAMFLSQAYSLYWAFYMVLSAVLDRFVKEEEDEGKLVFEGVDCKKGITHPDTKIWEAPV